MRINARAFVIGEGAHGSLTRQLSRTFNLHDGAQESQRYETGIKEVWEIPSGRLKAGELHHTFGYPLPASTYGGGWLYAIAPGPAVEIILKNGKLFHFGTDQPDLLKEAINAAK